MIAPLAKTRLTENLLGAMADAVEPDCVTPLVSFLASEQCEQTHEVYSVGGGRFARIFVGLAPGWTKGPGARATAEEVRDHLDQIRAEDGYIVPNSIADEMTAVMKAFKG